MRPLTFWPSLKSDSESVDFDEFPDRKPSSTFLLMLSTLEHALSYG